MAAPISEHRGVVDKFIGSTVMAFWGPPFVEAQQHCKLACLAALQQIKNLSQLESLSTGKDLSLHIGMAMGPLVVGNIGSETSKSFTVLGDTVNIASRLKGVSKQYGVYALIPEQMKLQIQDSIETREIDLIRVVGKDEPIRIYELLGFRAELDGSQLEFRDLFDQALSAYRLQQWDLAEERFKHCLGISGQDKSCLLFLQRIEVLKKTSPSENWDGVWQMTEK